MSATTATATSIPSTARWSCSASSTTAPITTAPPYWAIGWDVFCWIGHRRCSRHMAIPLIRSELLDDYAIALSDDAIEKSIRRYQAMLAARQQDPEGLRRQYATRA